MALRIGLIGAGVMGRRHTVFLSQNTETELAAISDPFSRTLANDLGVTYFADYREMLLKESLDGIIIANPNDLHVTTALDCIAANIPILLEKPVGTSLEEVKKLIAAESHSKVPVLVGHHRRHNPIIQQAKAIIDSDKLGIVTTFTALWELKKPDEYFDVAWRRQEGAGVLLINLVHDLDLMRYLCGEVETVQAITSNTARKLEVEDSAAILLQFSNGVLGTLTGSDACATPWSWDQSSGENPAFAQEPEQPCYLIGGTNGALSIPQLRIWSYGEKKGWHHPLLENREWTAQGTALGNQLEHFIQVIRHEAAPLISASDAAKTLALVEASRIAAIQRCPINIQSVMES